MQIQLDHLDIYTDGSCYDTSGGWAFVILGKNSLSYGFGGAINTTVNQMEMVAAIMALQSLPTFNGMYCNKCLGYRPADVGPRKLNFSSCNCAGDDLCLPRIKGVNPVKIFTDSKYLRDGIEDHIFKWMQKEFKTHDGSDVKNAFLWHSLYQLQKIHGADWQWIKGHSGVEYNELADQFAGQGRKIAMDYRKDEVDPAGDMLFNFKGVGSGSIEELAGSSTIEDYIVAGKFKIVTEYLRLE